MLSNEVMLTRKISLILAGGCGTRLWPLSRELYPKQFAKTLDENSTFQNALLRAVTTSENLSNVYVVTNKDYIFHVLGQAEEIGFKLSEENVLTEPLKRNTAPAIYYGVKYAVPEGEDALVSVLPADHVVPTLCRYEKMMEAGLEVAEKGYLVTFGIKPNRPETGYGYIKAGERVYDSAYVVERFVEKPDLRKAKQFLKEGGYYWNSGMFAFKASVFKEEVKKHLPEVYEAFTRDDWKEHLEEIYERLPEISVDYGVMERSDRVAVVPADIEWSDIGSFDSLYDILEKDSEGNAVMGRCYLLDSRGNLVIGERLVALIGIQNLMVLDTGDALLVCPRGRGQDVKVLFKKLKENGDSEAIVHRTVYRPWGSYTVLEEGPGYKVKRLTVLPHKRLSLQMHYHRSEHWVVIRGMAKVTKGDKTFFLRPQESTFVPPGVIHRLENPGRIPLEVIEVQNGEYIREDDIVRIQDDFKRDEKGL